MKFYMAPLEGITTYLYRNAYHQLFEPMDKYFTPFISTNQQTHFSAKDKKEILPENNAGLPVVPQILTNKSDEFITTANAICTYGYDEVNLNLGCPSNTVVAKNKGSGFLFHQEQLDRFLDDIYSRGTMKISIKTRLGKYDPEEFYALIAIFKKYPLSELIVHPRITKNMYKNTPNLKVYKETTANLPFPVCYNGDLFTVSDFQTLTSQFPDLDTVMLGRGVISNPALLGLIKGKDLPDKMQFLAFHDRLLEAYQTILSGDRNVLYKMREFWFYLIHLFTNSKQYGKKIKKCEDMAAYRLIVASLFREEALIPDSDGFRTAMIERL